jgi:hypothetical protein
MLIPGLRRMVDFESGGWDPSNPISLTPFLVSGVAAIDVFKRLPQLGRRRMWPWIVAVACITCGFFVGILTNGPLPAMHSYLAWLAPLMFGLAIALEWRRYPECAALIGRAFCWGTLLLSAYAIWQFLDPPPWDRLWVESAGMNSVGFAFPYRIRVFSLMNGPLSFALFLIAGVFVAFAERLRIRIPAICLALVALLLTLVRSAWLALPLAAAVYVFALPLRATRRVALIGVVAATMVLSIPRFLPDDVGQSMVDLIRDRAESLGSLSQDISFSERSSFMDQMSVVVLDNPVGHGLGSTGVSSTLGDPGTGIRDFDSGILAVFYALGWFGGVGFLGATCYLIFVGFERREGASDTIAKAARAIMVATFALSLGGNVFEGVSAAIFWGFTGLLLASHHWRSSLQHRTPLTVRS